MFYFYLEHLLIVFKTVRGFSGSVILGNWSTKSTDELFFTSVPTSIVHISNKAYALKTPSESFDLFEP